MKITAIIERNDNNYYQISSPAELMDHGLGGYGYSVMEAKEDFMRSVAEAREMIVEETGSLPEEFESVEVEWRYDLPSFFNNFD